MALHYFGANLPHFAGHEIRMELQCAVLLAISDRLLRRCVECLRCVGPHQVLVLDPLM